jgi:hypothetical protein
MTTIKKGYTELYNVLIANEDKKVSEILEQLIPIMESQQRDKNHFEDEHGLWVFCYYHKEWELTSQVEYGKKANTATGLNSMCKVGTNQWTKQQREFKKAKADLLNQVASGELAIEDINDKIEELEEVRTSIKPLFESHFEEALEDPRQLEDEA